MFVRLLTKVQQCGERFMPCHLHNLRARAIHMAVWNKFDAGKDFWCNMIESMYISFFREVQWSCCNYTVDFYTQWLQRLKMITKNRWSSAVCTERCIFQEKYLIVVSRYTGELAWSLFLRVLLTRYHICFRYWRGAKQMTWSSLLLHFCITGLKCIKQGQSLRECAFMSIDPLSPAGCGNDFKWVNL